MAPYLDPKRFHWVIFRRFVFLSVRQYHADRQHARTWGLRAPAGKNAWRATRSWRESKACPPILAGMEDFVRRTLTDNQKKRGGVAMKFEAAYFRSLYFTDPPRATAAAIYDKYHAGWCAQRRGIQRFSGLHFRRAHRPGWNPQSAHAFPTARRHRRFTSASRKGDVLKSGKCAARPALTRIRPLSSGALARRPGPITKKRRCSPRSRMSYLDTSFQSRNFCTRRSSRSILKHIA